jgi:drug/metabolite transporter (DMT)-like permease
MTWVVLAFLTAFFESLKDVGMKKSLADVPERIVAWSWMFFALLFLLPALWIDGIPPVDNQFWFALLSGGILNLVAINLYVSAIKTSALSTTVPMIAFSPLFLLITSPLILGEFPGFWGVIGVLLVIIGSYMLHIKERQRGYLAPYKALLRERGPKLMLAVAFIWSIAANIDKIGVQHSSPLLWVIAVNMFIVLAMLPMLLRVPDRLHHLRAHAGSLLIIGLFSALALFCQMNAITLTLVAYVIAIKRISTLLSVVWGGVIFKEQDIRERLTGASIMLAGVLCITLFA